MSFAQTLRTLVPLVTGLAIGGVGVGLFGQSFPGAEGTPEARANKLELDLKRAENRIAELEAATGTHGSRPGKRTFTDGMRDLARDIREGRPVSPDDIFRNSQPLLRDIAPLFERIRIHNEAAMIDSLTGEMTRKYGLDASQQSALKKWFEAKSGENARGWTDLVSRQGTTLADIAKESKDLRPDKDIDGFMESTLGGDKLAAFKTDRLNEKSQRVQQDADMRVERLDSIVHLDDGQRDQVFGIMARNSPDYDPAMKLEGGVGDIAAAASGSREDATLAVLRPDQREAYQAERRHRMDDAQKNMATMGLKLPANWDALDQ